MATHVQPAVTLETAATLTPELLRAWAWHRQGLDGALEGRTSQEVLAAHVTQPPAPLGTHRPACPAELEAVIMKCLAKRPSDRWQTADELLAALEPLATSSGGITPTSTRPMKA